MKRIGASALVFLLSLFTVTGFAQNATTSLRGTIKDPSGAVVPGATITLLNKAAGQSLSVKSKGTGEYEIPQLPPATYVVTVSAAGFGSQSKSAQLLVSQPATIDFALTLKSNDQIVDVTAAAQTINTTDATIGNAINNDAIMEFPSEGRDPASLLATQPGVLFLGSSGSGDSRNGVVSGARADQTNITLDGVDNNDQVSPSAFNGVLRLTLDSTEEFRVTTSNANADTGRSSGGQVNLVTKSGTNQVHGAIYEYNRTNFGLANEWFNRNAQFSSGVNTPPKLIRNTYGADVGFPIIKNKLFLFANYEGDRINEGSPVTEIVPTDSFRNGILKYIATDGSIISLTPTQFASMDPNCTANGTCPQGPGVNPSVIDLFATYPHANSLNGGDGLNSATYTFSSPTPTVQGNYISRLDYTPSEKHRFYVRGSFQNDTAAAVAYYPGQPPSGTNTNDSRGISANYTYTISNSLVNNFRYGFIRQSYASSGIGQGSYVSLRGLNLPEASTRNSKTLVPAHNFIDDLSYIKGKHSLQFGFNVRAFNYKNSTDANSYDSVSANAYWMVNSGYAGTGGTFDPAAFDLPAVSDTFTSNYDFAVTQLAGLTNEETDRYNYLLSKDGTTGTLLGLGTPVQRSFEAHEVEYYIQDSFKPIPNLTITAGIRHTILQTPYETNGQQVQPTINMHDWFNNRAAGAAQGQSIQPEISFAPAGQSRGGKPFYPMNWGNVAPRVAFAFSPITEDGSFLNKIFGGAGKSSIRAGGGMYYDHFGEGLVTSYSRAGSYSLSTALTNAASVLTADTSPRYAGLHTLPGLIAPGAQSIAYPQTPSDDPNGAGFAITQGLDDRIKTPYSEVYNLSFQRELKGGFTIETDYVGRFGRHLLQQLDLAQPLNLVDTKSGMDYYTAGTMLSQFVDQGRTSVPSIPYFEDLFPDAAGLDVYGDGAEGNSATQNIYNDLWQYVRGNETAALDDLDVYCYPGCGGQTGRYWPLQYSSLYVTASNGTSNYNSGQFILRHPMKHGIQFDLSYTYSKSMDLGSDSEGNTTASGNSYGFLLDGFNPRKNYAVSDFDTTHLLTASWVLKLPVGQGQAIAGSSNHFVNAVIGGWNLAGVARRSSGLPFGVFDGNGWSTNWEYESYEVQTGPIKLRKHETDAGSEQVFDDPLAAKANLRDPYPGEAGQRNRFRGDGYFDLDAGLHKDFHFAEHLNFKFAWEVFNVSNTPSFDVHSLDTGSTDYTQLGVYSNVFSGSTGNGARRMQFSGRIEF